VYNRNSGKSFSFYNLKKTILKSGYSNSGTSRAKVKVPFFQSSVFMVLSPAGVESVVICVVAAVVGAGVVVVIPRVRRSVSWFRACREVELFVGNILARSLRGGTPGSSTSARKQIMYL
jgi:hypothetical protein